MGNKQTKKDKEKGKDQHQAGATKHTAPRADKAHTKDARAHKDKSKKKSKKNDKEGKTSSGQGKSDAKKPVSANNKKGKEPKVSKIEETTPKKSDKKSLKNKNKDKEKTNKSKRDKSKGMPKPEHANESSAKSRNSGKVAKGKTYHKKSPKAAFGGASDAEKSIISAKTVPRSKKITPHKPPAIQTTLTTTQKKFSEEPKERKCITKTALPLEDSKQERKLPTVKSKIFKIKSDKTKTPFVIGDVSRPPKEKSPKVKAPPVDTERTYLSKEESSVHDLSSISSRVCPDLDFSGGLKNHNGKSLDDTESEGPHTPIFKEEFEHLYEKLKELNRSVLILKESYRSLIRSLLAMAKQNKSNPGQAPKTLEKTTNMLTTVSELKSSGGKGVETIKTQKRKEELTSYQDTLEINKSDDGNLSEKVVVDSRFAMERFLNPHTRDDTFRDLFTEVNALNDSVASLKELFDADGDFMIEEYLNSDYKISRSAFDSVRQKTLMLLNIVTAVTRAYNQDLLDLFRIK